MQTLLISCKQIIINDSLRKKQGIEHFRRKYSLGKLAAFASPSSIRNKRLYLDVLSERAGAPVLINPALTATAKSAKAVSSVSPERWEITQLYPPVRHPDSL